MSPTTTQRMRGFFAGTVGRPVGLMVAFVTLIVVGLIAYARVPLQLFPSEFSEPQIYVWVPNPGGDARENEELVARPIEDQIRTLSGVENVDSESGDDWVQFRIQFQSSMDMDLARAEVRDRLERAWPLLPETAETAGLWSESASSLPISFFGITVRGDPDRRDYLMEKVVVPKLEAVQGIGKVDVWGVLRDSVRILLDEDAVTAAQLDLGAVIARLSQDNFALPMGEVKDGGREILLRSDMRFQSVEEIAEFPIGNGLKLQDVGRVAKVKSVDNMLTLIDGNYAYFGMATKDSQSNVVETSKNLKEAFAELEEDPLAAGDVSSMMFFVQGDFIESALAQLRQTAAWGGVLAVIVLFVFLRRVRLTLCVALSIPVSALMAIVFQYFTGGSFNILTMTGITLGIGMLVDNSVVVVENIARVHQKGEHPLRSAVVGTRQIALAVTLATMTTVVVFLPLIFMTENKMMQIVFGGIGIPLSVSLLASLLVAVVFLPVIAGRILGARPASVDKTAGWIAPVVRIPVRAFAWGIGGLRLVWFLALRGMHYFNRGVLAILTPLRWVVAIGAVVLVVMQVPRIASAFQVGDSLAEYGIRLGGDPTPFIVSSLAIPALLVLLLALLGLKRWRRRPALPVKRPARFVPPGNSLVQMAIDLNHSLVEWTLAHRLAAAGLALLAFFSINIPTSLMTITAFGEDAVDDDADFRVVYDTDFTLAEAEQETRVYCDYVEGLREELGYEHWSCRFDEGGAHFSIYFGERRPDEEVDDLEARLERDLPRVAGHKLVFYNENDSSGRTRDVARFELTGPDSSELERLGAQAQEILEEVPGLSQVTSPLSRAPKQIEVRVDRELAHDMGVSGEAVQSSISWALGGWPLPRYQEEGREIPLLIEFDEEKTAGLPTLRDLAVWSESSMVPLSSFSDLIFSAGTRSIHRRNGKSSFTLEAKVDDPLRVIPITESAYTALRQLELPRGFEWDRSESASSRTEEEFKELSYAFLLSVVLVFLLMGILFESVLLPFSVLFTIPFAAMGAMWTLFLTGTPMDSFGWIGLIILAGVVVNNGIVLIDRIHGLGQVMPRDRAVVLGCGQRVRPVLMTALTTVCGLTPMMLAEPPAESMVDYRALATIVGGGLVASTFFTLWVVPLAYTVFDDLSRMFSERLRWWLRRPGRGDAAPEAPPEGSAPALGLRR